MDLSVIVDGRLVKVPARVHDDRVEPGDRCWADGCDEETSDKSGLCSYHDFDKLRCKS